MTTIDDVMTQLIALGLGRDGRLRLVKARDVIRAEIQARDLTYRQVTEEILDELYELVEARADLYADDEIHRGDGDEGTR